MHGGEAELTYQFRQPFSSAGKRSKLGAKIALALDRRAYVGQHEREQLAIEMAGAHQMHGRNANPFLIDLASQGHGAGAHAADVGMMRAISDEERRALGAWEEDGSDRCDIRQMGATVEGIVEDGDVAGAEFQGLSRGPHRQRHCAQVHRHVIAHGDGIAMRIVDGTGIIAAFLDVHRVGTATQDHPHLLGDGDQKVAEQLELDRVYLHSPARMGKRAKVSQPVAVRRST